jgi:capsular exopolysaccharide synthesis family protein
VQQGLNIQRRDARNQANIYGGRIGVMPTQEREFMELSREQQIKASLFLMLLQKREENALELAATANSAKVLDEALTEGQVSPRKMILLLAALMLGVLIPAGIIYLNELLQYKVRTRSDVDRLSKVPVLGEIPKHKEEKNVVVDEQGNNSIDEAFRMARTNLLLTLGTDNKVVTVTSAVAGEGKTFVAINMALSTAFLNKKVLLIGLDLRMPRLREYLKLETKNGMTNYLSGFEKNIDNLIVQSGLHPNLFVITAGPVPPNPAELLSRPSLDKAIGSLREEFDYIFIDSSPSALVTDTLVMNRVTDATLYVCRNSLVSIIRISHILTQRVYNIQLSLHLHKLLLILTTHLHITLKVDLQITQTLLLFIILHTPFSITQLSVNNSNTLIYKSLSIKCLHLVILNSFVVIHLHQHIKEILTFFRIGSVNRQIQHRSLFRCLLNRQPFSIMADHLIRMHYNHIHLIMPQFGIRSFCKADMTLRSINYSR